MSIQSTNKLRIGISFDRPEEYPEVIGPSDCFAEFEPESTILAMEDAIRWIDAVPVRVGGPRHLLHHNPDVDLIWNISEGYGSKNREGWVPLICAMYQIPCLGSDAFTLDLSLDKSATKKVAKSLGILTSPWGIARFNIDFDEKYIQHIANRVIQKIALYSNDPFDPDFENEIYGSYPEFNEIKLSPLDTLDSLQIWPLFVKPRNEGTGKGIKTSSKVHNDHELAAEIKRQFSLYQQDLIVESFLNGPEFTVALSGNPLQCHPVLERGLDAKTGIGMHILDADRSRSSGFQDAEKLENQENDAGIDRDYTISNSLTYHIEEKIQYWSRLLCDEMSVLDFARLDFKMDLNGQVHFLEINTLPTFAVDNNFAILAELQGVSYESFLGEILRSAIQRVGFQI